MVVMHTEGHFVTLKSGMCGSHACQIAYSHPTTGRKKYMTVVGVQFDPLQ